MMQSLPADSGSSVMKLMEMIYRFCELHRVPYSNRLIHGLLSVMCCLSCFIPLRAIVHCPSSIVRHPSSVVRCPSSIIHCPSSVVHLPSSVIHCLFSIFCHLSSVSHHLSSV